MKRTADAPPERSAAPAVRKPTRGSAHTGAEFVASMRTAADERRRRDKAQAGPWRLPPDMLALLTPPPLAAADARPEPPLRASLGAVHHEPVVIDAPVRTEAPLPPVMGALDFTKVPGGAFAVPVVPAGFNACVRLNSRDEAETETMETD